MNKWILHTSPLNTTTMYTTIRLSSIIFMMTFVLTSCDKDPLEACAEDPSCEYFRCKVNGEWWTPDCEDGPLFGCRHTDVQYYFNTSGTVEFSSKSQKNNEGIYMLIHSVFEVDTIFNHYSGPNVSSGFRRSNIPMDCRLFDLVQKEKSIFKLTKIDKSSNIIEGEFSFIAKNSCNETVNITSGEFRQHYRF
ncbi:MAG: hypothetical protein R2774_01365 [Saprospiraceae bacterium]